MAPAYFLTGDPVTIPLVEPYAGAEAEVLTDVPIGVTTAIGYWMVVFGKADPGSVEENTALRSAWTVFAGSALVSWNLHDRAGAVPPDDTAIARLSPRFITALLGLWADRLTAEEPDGR